MISCIKDILKSKQKKQKLKQSKNVFELIDGTNMSNIKRAEIEIIDTFKWDLITEDQSCLEIQVTNKQFYYSEYFVGWIEFKKELQIQLAKLDNSWLNKFSKPPLDEARVEIFPKSEYNQK